MNNHQINKINKKQDNSGKYYIQTRYQLNSISNTTLDQLEFAQIG